jgi:hypothetical protein
MYQLMIRSIATPVRALKYFKGPNSLSAVEVVLISNILDSIEKIESFTTSNLEDSFSSDLDADSICLIEALLDLTTRLPLRSVNCVVDPLDKVPFNSDNDCFSCRIPALVFS